MVSNNTPNGVIFLLLVDKGFSQETGFECLQELKMDFERTFSEREINRARPYSFNSKFKRKFKNAFVSELFYFHQNFNFLKVAYNQKGVDKAEKVRAEFADLKSTMESTFEDLLRKDAKMQRMLENSDKFTDLTTEIAKKGKTIKQNTFWNKIGFKIMLGVIALILLYVVAGMICGFTLSGC